MEPSYEMIWLITKIKKGEKINVKPQPVISLSYPSLSLSFSFAPHLFASCTSSFLYLNHSFNQIIDDHVPQNHTAALPHRCPNEILR